MNTHDIEPMKYGGNRSDDYVTGWNDCWAAIEADRKQAGDLEAQLENALTERDDYHDIADHLAEQIAAITDQEIGEHSSGNNPWQNAMLAADEWIAKDIRRLTDGGDHNRRGEPVKVPSDLLEWLEEAIDDVIVAALEEGMSGQALGDTPLTDSAKLEAMARCSALLAKYGQQADPVEGQPAQCAASTEQKGADA